MTVAKTNRGFNRRQKAMRHVVMEMMEIGKSDAEILKTVADMKAGKSIDRIYTKLIAEIKTLMKKRGVSYSSVRGLPVERT
jgi:hypothetical protein